MSKYHNIPTTIDGIRFPSRREAARYSELKLLQKAGRIKDLKLHTRHLLLAGDKARNIRPMYYEDDFSYRDKDGNLTVEDTKGVRTDVYKIKKKMMAVYHNIDIREV